MYVYVCVTRIQQTIKDFVMSIWHPFSLRYVLYIVLNIYTCIHILIFRCDILIMCKLIIKQVADCLNAISTAMTLKLLDFSTFDINEYAFILFYFILFYFILFLFLFILFLFLFLFCFILFIIFTFYILHFILFYFIFILYLFYIYFIFILFYFYS